MFWNATKRAKRVDEIAAAAYNSSRPGNEAIILDFTAWTPMVRALFEKYGTTQEGAKAGTNPRMFAGYMSYNGSYEFLAVIVLSRQGTIVTGFRPPEDYGQDMASLLKKSVFFDEVVASIRRGDPH